MGIIKVETPQGIVKVEIDGEEPTQEELQDIDAQFFGPSVPTRASVDLATASTEEIRDYARAQRLAGCLLYTSPSPRDGLLSRMPSSA